jgi:hypothetical protein
MNSKEMLEALRFFVIVMLCVLALRAVLEFTPRMGGTGWHTSKSF